MSCYIPFSATNHSPHNPMTVDALTIYRQSILIWDNTLEDAFDITACWFGKPAAEAARDAYNADPALRELNEELND